MTPEVFLYPLGLSFARAQYLKTDDLALAVGHGKRHEAFALLQLMLGREHGKPQQALGLGRYDLLCLFPHGIRHSISEARCLTYALRSPSDTPQRE